MNQLPIGSVVYDGVGLMYPPNSIKACQVGDAVSLYLDGHYGVPASVVHEVVDSGGKVSPNWEHEGNVLLSSHPGPLVAIAEAMQRLGEWGVDPTKVMTFFSTVDFDPVPSQFDALDRWHQPFVVDAVDKHLSFGIYGATRYLQHLATADWYPAEAGLWVWAGAGSFPGETMKQEYNHANDPRAWWTIGCTTDSSIVQEPLSVHGKLVIPDPQEGPVPAHVCYAQAGDGSGYIQIVDRLDGTQGWRHVGEIPGGAGGFYATHPGAQGVNTCGANEMAAMGHYDNVQDQQWMAAHSSGTGASADEILNAMAVRLGNG